MNRLVDYEKFLEIYRRVGTKEGRAEGYRYSLYGSFPRRLLTELGRKALEGTKFFLGREARFRGASKKGMYLKWEVRNDEEGEVLSTVVLDFLRDLGIDIDSAGFSRNRYRSERRFFKVVLR